MNINLTPIIQAIILLCAALITYRLIPWIKANTTEKQQTQLRAAVKVAIFAAEQIYGASHGSEKLDYAIKWLSQQGFNVDRAEIEAAVYEALNMPTLNIDTVNLQTSGELTVKENASTFEDKPNE